MKDKRSLYLGKSRWLTIIKEGLFVVQKGEDEDESRERKGVKKQNSTK